MTIMDLLRGSLLSTTPLSDFILHKSCSNDGLVGVLQHRMNGSSSSGNGSQTMIVKAWVKKSDSKFLFVQAEEDFVDFLFSLLVIPLSGIESLLGGNTLLKNIDNLYTSIADVVDDHKYLSRPSKKNRLTKPELPPNYLSKNQMFPLSEQTNPNIYLVDSVTVSPDCTREKGSWIRFKDPKGDKGSYVKRPGKFMVDDNLTIVHWDSNDSVLEGRDIDLSDINEIELHIGLDEALNILKASLSSNNALSDALHNQILEKFEWYIMSDPNNVQFPLKVVLNKQKTKVLYAEANSDFADILLSFLTLPLGTIVRVLQKHDPAVLVGSITNLYKSLASLDSVHFQTEVCKQMLLNPRSSSEAARHKLKFNVDDTDEPTNYFRCASCTDCSFTNYPNVSMYCGILITCGCGRSTLSKEIVFNDTINKGIEDGVGGVFTKGTAQFIISDDLQILPSGMGNVIRLISNMGIITDTDVAELMDVTFGFKEIMDLLKGALLSCTPLTDIVLNKVHGESFAAKYEMGTLVPPNVESTTFNTKELVVKAIIQKSTNKLLYVEGDDEFVEFLFSLFTIPLGGIEHLLGGRTNFKNIDNLYRTLGEINGDKYLKTQATKTMLLNPKLPFGFTSNTRFLPLTEEIPPPIFYYFQPWMKHGYFAWQDRSINCTSVIFKSPKDPGNYIKEPTMYMVTDDLVVTPLCTSSGISLLNHLNIPLLDVREQELNIGLEEGLRILRASLTSTCCLSKGLSNLILEKQPKQELGV
ncbi:hypothetical protein CASFOL_020013 [Castilleja foliolosa]|uniref:DUF674 family protein n=1 Tax=Castilleja foliolosa TaxID=1961234 RepID=A0ABD3CZL7_9LAMI